MAARDAPGWFGKIAALGDFGSRRMEGAWVQACDQWLSEGLQVLQQQLGEDWLRGYLAAPVWRFAWAPGVVNTQWWFGVLMPSCDRVGRYFPLLIAQPRAQAPLDRYALDHLELWWAHLARAAVATLAEDASLEHFEDELQHAPPWPAGGGPAAPRRLPAAAGERYALAGTATLNEVMHALAAASLLQQLAEGSFWWPMSEPGVPGQCSLWRGLPSAASLAQMLGGPVRAQ